MFGALRTAISVIFIATLTWAAFTVDLGRHTFAEHVDRISKTREAEQLMKGTRERVNPALEEAKQRVLGEHIEAPTHIAGDRQLPAASEGVHAPTRARVRRMPAQSDVGPAPVPDARASDASSTRLPGRD